MTLVPNTYVIDVPDVDLLAARARIPAVMDYLEEKALPNRRQSAEKEAIRNGELLAKNSAAKPVLAFTNFLNKSWWRHWRRRDDMLEAISKLDRYIALTIVAAKGRMSIYQFVDKSIRPDASLQVFTIDDDFSFGVLSSTLHRKWFDERCSKLKVDPRYTPTTVWNTFRGRCLTRNRWHGSREPLQASSKFVKSILEWVSPWHSSMTGSVRQASPRYETCMTN